MKVQNRSSYHRLALSLLLGLLVFGLSSVLDVPFYGVIGWMCICRRSVMRRLDSGWRSKALLWVLSLIIYAIAMNRLDRRYLELKDREDAV